MTATEILGKTGKEGKMAQILICVGTGLVFLGTLAIVVSGN